MVQLRHAKSLFRFQGVADDRRCGLSCLAFGLRALSRDVRLRWLPVEKREDMEAIMIKPIMRNELLLGMPSEPATEQDVPIGRDLLDTLAAHADSCVGMAANMIGVRKRIIVFDNNGTPELMFNPEIMHASNRFKTEEGCLSLVGVRPCERFRKIHVAYQDASFVRHERSFSGFTAQIIQHEIDHCNGIVI